VREDGQDCDELNFVTSFPWLVYVPKVLALAWLGVLSSAALLLLSSPRVIHAQAPESGDTATARMVDSIRDIKVIFLLVPQDNAFAYAYTVVSFIVWKQFVSA
jgi:hypothetical protein